MKQELDVTKHTHMTFGERLMMVRKKKKMSQYDVGKIIGMKGDAYGRYERGEVKPTIETATKISNALDVSLDFLVGKVDWELDQGVLKKVQEVSNMNAKDKEHVFSLLDAFIAKTRLNGLA